MQSANANRGVDALAAAACSPLFARLLTALWILLPLVATQVPQKNAPLTTTDGLSRADLLVAATHGLDGITDSTAFWLLLAATLVALLARWLMPPPAAGDPAREILTYDPATTPAADIERALGTGVASSPLARLAAPRSRAIDGGRVIVCGQRGPGLGLLAVGALLLVGASVRAAHVDAPTVLEVPLVTGGAPLKIAGRRAEAGRLVNITGHFEAACEGDDQRVVCRLDALGQRGAVDLRRGSAADLGPYTVTWAASTSSPAAESLGLQWRLPDAAGQAAWYAFDVAHRRHAAAESLGVAVSTYATSRSGPVMIATHAPAKAGRGLVIAGPGLLPGAEPAIRARAPGGVRLLITRGDPTFATLAALLCLTLGGLLFFAVPSARVHVDEQGAVAVLTGVNRPWLRGRIADALGSEAGP